MCFITGKKSAAKRGSKKTQVAPVSQKAPMAPTCPANLNRPSTSTAPIESRAGRDTGCGFIPKKSFLEEKLAAEVQQYDDKEHRDALRKTEAAVKKLLKSRVPGIKIWTTGSLAAGVDLFSSDLDMSIKVPGLTGDSFQQLHHVRKCLVGLPEFKKVKVQAARVPVMQLVYAETKVEIDVTINNDDAKRNTQLLVWYGQIDARFPALCKAVKGWASSVGVEGAKNARLNSFTLCLMVIHYLQVGVFPAIFPCLQELFPELHDKIEVEDDDYNKRNLRKELKERGHRFEENESTIGVLFAGFLKYYAEFDFNQNWISVRRGKAIEKRWDEEEQPMDGMPQCSYYIVVEDPFISPAWNCAGSAYFGKVFERLCLEFQLSYARLVKNNSIFGGSLMSVSRMKLEAAGKERDLQIEKWREEIMQKRMENVDDWVTEDRPWGEVQEEVDADDWYIPFENHQHPKQYWDLQTKKTELLPWPEKPPRVVFE